MCCLGRSWNHSCKEWEGAQLSSLTKEESVESSNLLVETMNITVGSV